MLWLGWNAEATYALLGNCSTVKSAYFHSFLKYTRNAAMACRCIFGELELKFFLIFDVRFPSISFLRLLYNRIVEPLHRWSVITFDKYINMEIASMWTFWKLINELHFQQNEIFQPNVYQRTFKIMKNEVQHMCSVKIQSTKCVERKLKAT